MILPQFIDLSASSPDEQGYPTEIAWSLPDGSIKCVQILPDDDWSPWDNHDADTDVQHLMDHGVSCMDIVRELNDDLNGQTVYSDGLDFDSELLEKLYESCGEEPAFELTTISELFPDTDNDLIYDQLRQIAEQNSLDLQNSEDTVRALLYANHNLTAEL